MDESSSSTSVTGLRLWHSLIAGLLGGWFLAAQFSEHVGNGFATLSNLQRVFQPGFLGMAAGQSIGPIGAGVVFWLIAKAIPSLRKHAAQIAMFGVVAIFLALLVGENSQQNHQAKEQSLVNSSTSAPQPQQSVAPQAPALPPVATTSSERGWDLSSLPNLIDSRWQLISSSPTSKEYVDTQSVSGDTYQQSVWLKDYFGVPQDVNFSNQGPYFITRMSHTFIRCSERSYAIGDTHYYASNGKGIAYPYDWSDARKSFSPIEPNDSVEPLFNLLCK